MNEHDLRDKLQLAVEALQSQTSEGPPVDLVASTVEALQNQNAAPSLETAADNRRRFMLRMARIGTLSTAGVVLITLVGFFLINRVDPQKAFSQVVKKVQEAKAAKFELIQTIGDRPAMKCECAFLGNVVRTERPGQWTYLADSATRRFVQLIPSQKLAFRGKIDDKVRQGTLDVRKMLKEMTEKHGKHRETIDKDGKKIDVYDVTHLPKMLALGELGKDDSFRMWVDRKTKLPTRIVVKMKNAAGSGMPINMEMKRFDWNPKFPAGTFDLKVPQGYTLQKRAK